MLSTTTVSSFELHVFSPQNVQTHVFLNFLFICHFHLSTCVCLSDSSHPTTKPGDAAFTVGWPTPLDLGLGARPCLLR